MQQVVGVLAFWAATNTCLIWWWWSLYWLVEGALSSLGALCFLPRAFMLLPRRYFLLVMHNASSLAFTWYTSCTFLCVVPPLNLFRILNVKVAANSQMRLFIFSLISSDPLGSGVIITLTHSAWSSGSFNELLAAVVTSSPAAAFNCIKGQMLAFMTTISCFGLNIFPNKLQAVASWSCTTSKVSNSSAISILSDSASGSSASTAWIMFMALGTSSVGSISSNIWSNSSDLGSSTLKLLVFTALMTVLTSASCIICRVFTRSFLYFWWHFL